MQRLWRDVLHGVRVLRKDPGFAAAAVLTLALGIGANSTVFSWINATLLNPIPGAWRTNELMSVTRGQSSPYSYPDFLDLRAGNHSFSGLTAVTSWPMSLTGKDRPERIWGSLVSANYFELLGVKPMVGRGFLPAEDTVPNGAPVAVISYRLWQDRFGGDPGVLGRTISINAHAYTIVGVTPPIFQGNYTGLRAALWLPVTMAPQFLPDAANRLDTRDDTWLNVLGRLRPGVDRQQAQAEMAGLFEQIARQYPDSHKGRPQVTLYQLWRAPNGANGLFSKLFPLLLGLAAVVLLLACANLANLMLARGVSRRREIAIRLALGASRARLVRQLLAENVVLSLAGGGVAFAATVWSSGSLMRFVPATNLPIWLSVGVDNRVMLATLGLSVLAAMLFGSLPAWRASAMDPVEALKDAGGGGGGRKGHLSSGLAMTQIALSLLLLVSAGLLIRSFRATRSFDPGFNPRNVLVESYDLFPSGYGEARGAAFDRQVLEKAAALPGVRSACLADWVPLGFSSNSEGFVPEGYAAGAHEAMVAGIAHVSPGYFGVMEIPLLGGRDFAPEDSGNSQRVVIVNQALVDRYWPGQQAVGKRIQIAGKWATVIGVARTTHYYDLDEEPKTFVYLPVYQFYVSEVTLHLRTADEPLAVAGAAGEAVHQLNASLPVFDVSTLEARIEVVFYGLRIAGTFVGAFAVLALVLAAVGIYGVVSHSTQQRTREMGIRMALGAQPGDVMRLILGQSARMIFAGTAAGLLAAFATTRLMSRALFGVTATDPLTFVGVTLLLASVALVACYLPARHAIRVDPLVALRHE
ncbi:MAG TPA: ABC transporter permease [Candidatus Acidoferrales bacterium]|nr:ABC transporter permease [Candidatus Acidoferrales bacterium]